MQLDVCYDNDERRPAPRGPEAHLGHGVLLMGHGCESSKQIGSRAVSEAGCFKDMHYDKLGFASVTTTQIGTNTYNVTKDLVGSNGCGFGELDGASFFMLDYFHCYETMGKKVFYPMTSPKEDDDGNFLYSNQIVMERAFDNANCTGNYTLT